MFKHLPVVCVALLALAACSNSNNSGAPAPAPSPAATSTVSTTPAPAGAVSAPSDGNAPAAATTAPSPAQTAAAPEATAAPPPFVDNGKWVEGKNYFLIDPPQPTGHPGKIEVTEVFSYGCPACNAFHGTVDRIARSLPADAVMNYLPASFRPDENWPLYQRAFFAAQALGLVAKTHDAMYDATWKSGELATYNLQSGQPKPRAGWPTIDDAAKFYAHYGVSTQDFLAAANSFAVNTQMKRADDLVKAYGVDATPTMIINGKYRYTVTSAGGYPEAFQLAQWLVAKEAAGK
ncbi:MAG: thiol:disulfide interchange protein DsbA/DsbL [Rhodanobacter sp.]